MCRRRQSKKNPAAIDLGLGFDSKLNRHENQLVDCEVLRVPDLLGYSVGDVRPAAGGFRTHHSRDRPVGADRRGNFGNGIHHPPQRHRRVAMVGACDSGGKRCLSTWISIGLQARPADGRQSMVERTSNRLATMPYQRRLNRRLDMIHNVFREPGN
jgi:hypothetical protein